MRRTLPQGDIFLFARILSALYQHEFSALFLWMLFAFFIDLQKAGRINVPYETLFFD